MADPKLLTEGGWKIVVSKNKIKDNGLMRALATYDKLDEDDHEACLKTIDSIYQLATTLKKSKEVAAVPDVLKYLTNLLSTADWEESEVTKARAEAEKREAAAHKQAEAQAKHEQEHGEDDDDDDQSDAFTKLKKSLMTLRTARAPFYFLACDAKPYGLVISKKDIRKSTQHRKELSELAGGSTRPPKCGEIYFDGSKLILDMEKPPSGIARILQKWIKINTGLGCKVMVGDESADDVDDGNGAPEETEAPKPGESPAKSPRDVATEAPPEEAKTPESTVKDAAADVPGKETPENMTRPLEISGTVGRGGKNKPEDVTAVQAALNLRAKAGLQVDGKCGPKTIAAIVAFQKSVGFAYPDGRIDPGKLTERALRGEKVEVPKAGAKGAGGAKAGAAKAGAGGSAGGSISNIFGVAVKAAAAASGAAAEAVAAAVKAAQEAEAQKQAVDKIVKDLLETLKKAQQRRDEAAIKQIQEWLKSYQEKQKLVKTVQDALKRMAAQGTKDAADAAKKVAEDAVAGFKTVAGAIQDGVSWLQKNAPSMAEDAKDLAKKIAKEIADQKQQAEKAFNDAMKTLKKATEDELDDEGRRIKENLEKAYDVAKGGIKVVTDAAADLVKQKTADAAEALKKAASVATPGLKTVEDLAKQALDWWNS